MGKKLEFPDQLDDQGQKQTENGQHYNLQKDE
jgi:hypothetical protein